MSIEIAPYERWHFAGKSEELAHVEDCRWSAVDVVDVELCVRVEGEPHCNDFRLLPTLYRLCDNVRQEVLFDKGGTTPVASLLSREIKQAVARKAKASVRGKERLLQEEDVHLFCQRHLKEGRPLTPRP